MIRYVIFCCFLVLSIVTASIGLCEYLLITYPTTDIQIVHSNIKQLQKYGFHPELKTKSWEGRNFYYIILGRYDSREIASKVLATLQNINIEFEILSDKYEEFDYELASSDEILGILNESKKFSGILKIQAREIKIGLISEPKFAPVLVSEKEEDNLTYESGTGDKSVRKKISEIAWELRRDGYRVDTEIGNNENSILVGIYNSIDSANDMKKEMEGYGYKAKVKEERGKDKSLFYVYVDKEGGKESNVERRETERIPAKRLQRKE